MSETDITFEVVDPTTPDAVIALGHYFAELQARFARDFDPGPVDTWHLDEFTAPDGAFVLAVRASETERAVVGCGGVREQNSCSTGDDLRASETERAVVGCGGVRGLGDGIGEIKRMWVSPDARGLGLRRLLLSGLEDIGRDLGHHTMRLDTNGTLAAAIHLYDTSGYARIARYNDNPDADLYFEKDL